MPAMCLTEPAGFPDFDVRVPGPFVQVRLNWENVGYRWVAPDAIRAMDTVPLLAET